MGNYGFSIAMIITGGLGLVRGLGGHGMSRGFVVPAMGPQGVVIVRCILLLAGVVGIARAAMKRDEQGSEKEGSSNV